jgi:hypothetical protein
MIHYVSIEVYRNVIDGRNELIFRHKKKPAAPNGAMGLLSSLNENFLIKPNLVPVRP